MNAASGKAGHNRRGRGIKWIPLAVALASVVVLSASTESSLGGFNAAITNSVNSVGSGTILLQENTPTTTCMSTGNPITSNAATCSGTGTDMFGASLNDSPGGTPITTSITVKNDGTIAAGTFVLTPGACSAAQNSATFPYYGSDSSGFCSKVDITIENDTVSGSPTCVLPAQSGACPALSAAANLGNFTSAIDLPSLGASGSQVYDFKLALDPSANNSDQGLVATMPLTWSIAP
ncbi:MAG: hypothetical protein HKL81_08220 [Acidimicrobiaceae bacterium]|nr:hypothetical protein [Acidimicrobiaceae bacterium]